MIDFLQFGFRGESKLISTGHVAVYRHLPKVFGLVYRGLEKHDPQRGDSLVYKATAGKFGAAEKLHSYLLAQGYDTVICVHIFAGSALTYLRRNDRAPWRQYFVATDYTCSPGAGDLEMDGYFTPHELLTDEFTKAGIPSGRIFPTGIPVQDRFLRPRDRTAARAALGLAPDRRSVLLMGGSMGAGPLVKLAKTIAKQLPADGELLVLCARNTHLQQQLIALKQPKLQALGFTDRVDLYLDASELLLTKAGGLSSTEALLKRLPIVYLDAVPGNETRNLDFLCALDCAVTADGVKALAAKALALFSDPAALAALSGAQERWFRQRAADDIAAAVSLDAKKS